MTPIITIAGVSFKREDHNPTGSAKDRALIKQIENLIARSYHLAVISSTGNAAISAGYYCQKHHIPLHIFISPHIHPNKLKLIKQYTPNIVSSLKPISQALNFSKTHHAYYLRQSTDPSALIGYQAIGKELLKQLPRVTSVFIPVGSGTTLLGITQSLPQHIKVFAVQPANNPSLCHYFQPDYPRESTSLTDALTIRSLPLKNKLIAAINQHHGNGIIVTQSENDIADKFLFSKGISTSPEGSLAYAGYLQAQNHDYQPGPFPLIILTGAKR